MPTALSRFAFGERRCYNDSLIAVAGQF